MPTLLPLLSGLLAGALHVLGGPDVVGLAPFSVEAGRQAWRVGLRWGIGHASASVLLGLVAYSARDLLDLDLLSESGEALAGLLLVAIGVWGLWHLRHVDAGERFLGRLRDVEEPERKRKIIGETFIEVFEEAASEIGDVDYVRRRIVIFRFRHVHLIRRITRADGILRGPNKV